MQVPSKQDTNGVAVRCLECPGFQTDRLTGSSPLVVNNATVHSRQLPIRKTVETRGQENGGGRNQCETGTALLDVE